ncbi:hypothetical protein J2Y66_003805 [Paenarthrobacter nitroguajacolicus]|uniref:NAD/NADP octopine/nopaline dehydrogenase family protein n=1 Tax=Paenarthrobacter nitroguajacolicus TaxID=211146 RepID=UPI0028657304|nr:NAD/NADP octopine/nopaline dehydrogenase family protein [Paenarthrobacter nitroguajacolicus]MDR6989290.1 hypothetical protein [Paenarthrobacter nitroguajacolicus]
MANILIRSDEANAAATALTLAVREHRVSLLTNTLAPGRYDFNYFGAQRRAVLHSPEELDPSSARVGVVFAEGESVEAGMFSVLEFRKPDLLAVIGGGISAAVEASETAQRLGFDASNILLIGAFLVGGDASGVTAEKEDVLAGFLGHETTQAVRALAVATFPNLALTDASSVALSSVNALFHVPPMILNAMSVERGDDIRFYVEGFGDAVCKLLLELDADRLRLGAALGRSLTPIEEINDIYSGPEALPDHTLREKTNTPISTQAVKLPSSFQHRFLAHELRSFFAPMLELGDILGVDLPTTRAVVRIGEILISSDVHQEATSVAQRFLRLIDASLLLAR